MPEAPPRLAARQEPVLTQFPRMNDRFDPREPVF